MGIKIARFTNILSVAVVFLLAVFVLSQNVVHATSCTPGSAPSCSGSSFSYCDSSGTLHSGTCNPGYHCGTQGSKSDSGVSCFANSTPTPTPSSAPSATSNPATTNAPTITPNPPAAPPAQTSTTTSSNPNACGTAIPSNFYSATQAQAQKENPGTTLTNCGNAGQPACQSLNANQYTQAAKDAGFTQAQVDQSGMAGSPYVPVVCQQNPSQCQGVPGAPSGQQVNYTGCLGVSDDFGTLTDMKAYCYQNGNLVSTQDINGNTDMVAVTQQTLGCTPGGAPYNVGQSSSTSTSNGQSPKPSAGTMNTTLGLNVGLSGLAGTNPTNLKQSIRDFVVQLLNQQNQVVASKTVPLNYNSTTQSFTGNVNLNALTQNVEGLKVAVNTPGYFQGSTDNVIPIAANQTNNISIPQLQAGNIVNDNPTANNVINVDQTPNVLDYNVLLSCSIFSKDGGAACNGNNGQSFKTAADLNGDGVVNQDDYTILLRSFKDRFGNSSSPTPKPTLIPHSTCVPRPASCSQPRQACPLLMPVGGWCQ